MTVEKKPKNGVPIDLEPFSIKLARSPELPDPASLPDPFKSAELRKYYQAVMDWHGYIKFLGLPKLVDETDVMIDRLYVEPFVAASRMSPDDDPAKWPPGWEHILDAVVKNPRLVLLGDPGSGKSTLVSWIAWRLCRMEETAWTKKLGRLIPIPMIVREMKLSRKVDSWDQLWEVFLEHPMTEALRAPELMKELLKSGQAMIMLDGLDELGDVEVRAALRRAVWDGMSMFSGCRWLMTSRIVGYDLAPFHQNPSVEKIRSWQENNLHLVGVGENMSKDYLSNANNNIKPSSWQIRLGPIRVLAEVDAFIPLMYLTPFTDPQIREFARNWFEQHEAAKTLREQKARELVDALHANPDALRLARVPILLTLMALIYRIKAFLPHGRAHVYSLITEAYLESIDTFRGIQEVHYSLPLKKRWLSYIGFQMQLKRGEGWEETRREVLASADEVRGWLREAMATDLDRDTADKEADKFIDYIGRRSGLLLPRGEGVFAFTHLSFQEYFTASFLAEKIMSPQWLQGKSSIKGAGQEDLKKYAREPIWKETMVLLYELLAEKEGWSEFLLELQFGPEFENVKYENLDKKNVERSVSRAELAAELSIDPHSRMSMEIRQKLWEILWSFHIRFKAEQTPEACRIAAVLFSAGTMYVPQVEQIFQSTALGLEPTILDLSGCSSFTSLDFLRPMPGLMKLYLYGCTGLNDLTPIKVLKGLQWLSLSDCAGISDLTPIKELKGLQLLYLSSCTGISDLTPIKELKGLQWLSLSYCTGISDLTPIKELKGLGWLYLSRCTGITDFSPIKELKGLQWLSLSDCTGISDLTPIKELKGLQGLSLSGCTGLTDLTPIKELKGLQSLTLSGCTGISDLTPIKELKGLQGLTLDGCTGLKEVPEELKNRKGLTIFGGPEQEVGNVLKGGDV